eukprot:scaffold18168_cov15-Prasinocladus_malaysianus.AAC.1
MPPVGLNPGPPGPAGSRWPVPPQPHSSTPRPNKVCTQWFLPIKFTGLLIRSPHGPRMTNPRMGLMCALPSSSYSKALVMPGGAAAGLAWPSDPVPGKNSL